MDALQDYYHFGDFYALVLRQQKANISIIFREQREKGAVLNMAKTFSLEDQLEDEIKRDEDAYFSAVGPERRAISIKVIIVSELNQSFIADKKFMALDRSIFKFLNNTI